MWTHIFILILVFKRSYKPSGLQTLRRSFIAYERISCTCRLLSLIGDRNASLMFLWQVLPCTSNSFRHSTLLLQLMKVVKRGDVVIKLSNHLPGNLSKRSLLGNHMCCPDVYNQARLAYRRERNIKHPWPTCRKRDTESIKSTFSPMPCALHPAPLSTTHAL